MEKWEEHEVDVLKKCYVEKDTTSDTLIKDKVKLNEFANLFNEKATINRAFSEEAIADKLLQLRKKGELPRLRS